MALVEQFGVGRWSVQLAAIWHWYLLLRIYVMLFILFVNLKKKKKKTLFWY